MWETSSSVQGMSGEQKPRRTPRRMKAAICCRSEDDAYPQQALQAYSNLVMTTDLKTACRAVSHKPCARSIVSAYRVWTLADNVADMVANRQFVHDSDTKYLNSRYSAYNNGVHTFRTQDTSDLPNFGPRTLRHVRSILTLRHWCWSVFGHFLDTSALYLRGLNSLVVTDTILVQQSHFIIMYFNLFYRKFAKYLHNV